MNKSTLIKIAGILVGSFVVITVATFFLYPYINEQKYSEIQSERQQQLPVDDFDGNTNSELASTNNRNTESSGEYTEDSDSLFVQEKDPQMMKIDSLIAANDSLTQQLDSAKISLSNFEDVLRKSGADEIQLAEIKRGEGSVEFITVAEEPKEEFSERVKSLLNLDEEELTPIANQMTQQQLVKIYSTSGNIQREKLLRSLSPERAAKLMQEIML